MRSTPRAQNALAVSSYDDGCARRSRLRPSVHHRPPCPHDDARRLNDTGHFSDATQLCAARPRCKRLGPARSSALCVMQLRMLHLLAHSSSFRSPKASATHPAIWCGTARSALSAEGSELDCASRPPINDLSAKRPLHLPCDPPCLSLPLPRLRGVSTPHDHDFHAPLTCRRSRTRCLRSPAWLP